MTYFTTGAQLQAALNALPNTKTGNFVAFDSFFYGQQYMADYQGTLSPIEHFVQIGAARGYKPNATFDPTYYKNAFADLKNTDFNAADLLYHFMQYGLDEGRTPNAALATFDGTAYLAANPDVAAYVNANLAQFGGSATNGALAHYVKFGAAEGRTGTSVSNGQTFTLTTGADDLTGTDADNTFDAPLSRAGELPVTEQTLQGIDSLDGGAGNDVLNASLSGFSGLFDAQNPEIKNIEQYNLTVSADGAAGGLDLARASGYKVLQNINSRGDLYLGNVNVSEDGNAPEIALTNVRGDTEITYDNEVDSISVQNVTASKVGLHDDDANLRIDVDSGRIETLNLDVSNGVYLNLEGDADRIQNLNISGSGILELEGNNDFGYLETLDSTKYTGDLNLDVSGSEVLESVNTGAGDDNVMVDNDAVDGGLVVDMGEGENALWVDDVADETDLSSLDFTGGVANVQTLALNDDVFLNGNASLDLTGFDENLSTVLFDEGLGGNGSELEVISPNADLTLASNGSFEDVDLHTNGITNLTVDVTDGNLDIDQLAGAELETLTLNQTADPLVPSYSALDITSDISYDVSNLQTITSTATGNASVEIDATSADANVGSLTSVNVTSTNGNATLNLTGRAGSAAVAGVRQVEQFVVNVGNSGLQAGQIIFASGDLTGGAIVTDYSENGGFLQPSRDNGSARDVANDLNASPDLSASVPNILGFPTGNTVTVEWADFGVKEQLTVLSATATSGTISSPTMGTTTLVTAGVTPEDMVAGNGFEALETATVVADDDAYVNLTDVYGALALDVTAGDALGNNAYINLYNTEVTTVAAAGYHVDVDAAGDTVGNGSLTSISVSSVTANITLEDNLESFSTLDVVDVSTYLVADTFGADFGSLATGEFITYSIGATSDGVDGTTDVDFTGNAVREVYVFAGGDIGEVVINNFTWGNDPVAGDRLDLSDFASNAGQLVFSDVGADLVITDLNGGFGDFGGSITIIGAAGQGLDVAQFNIIYA